MPTDAWDDIHVGKALGRHDVEITPDLVSLRSAAWGDTHAWYASAENPFGAPVAPAMVGAQEPWRFSGWYPPEMIGNLHARQEWDLFWPATVGSTITSQAQVTERYPWRGDRHVVVNEVLLMAADGRLLARGRTHQSFLLPAAAGAAAGGPPVVDRDRERREDRRFTPGEGQVLEAITGPRLELTPEACLAVADNLQNYHSDEEIARALGFPTVVVQGVVNTYLVSAVMTERFGAGWWCGGRLRMSFVNVVWGGDVIAGRVNIKEVAAEHPRARAECEVWVEKADGTVTAIGTASAVVPAEGGSVQ
ncbi:MAG: hypothetical protein QOE92_2036 [Chloroflexota bacterium]|nr:hypothetical protein [Chloroflexota bacterium]